VQVHGDDLPVRGSVVTGFYGTYDDVNALPAWFELNGVSCQSSLSMAGQNRLVTSPVSEPAPGPLRPSYLTRPARRPQAAAPAAQRTNPKRKGAKKDKASSGGNGKAKK
jgi:hypothetical protein